MALTTLGYLIVSLTTVVLILLSFFAQEGLAVRCYVCDSDRNPDCADTFNAARMYLQDCDTLAYPPRFGERANTCRKDVRYIGGRYRYVRECGFSSDFSGSMGCINRDGGQACFCSWDGCNSAVKIKSTLGVFLSLLALFVTYRSTKC